MTERPTVAEFEPVLTARWGDPEAVTIDGYERTGGYRGLRKALSMEPSAVIEEVKSSGLRGRGGAGFPTGTKWSFIPQDTGKPVYVVVNFDESEPGTFSNRELVERDPHQLVEGAIICAYAVGCRTAFVYCRGEFVWPGTVLERAIAEAYDRGYLGRSVAGSDFDLDLVLHRGAGAYICGEETALLESLEGYRGQPRLRPPFPAVEGLYRSPTVINNVETLANVPHIIDRGHSWYASIGVGKSTGSGVYSISGKVKRPGNYEAPMGTTARELMEEYAGGIRDGKRLKAFTPGGSSTPFLTADHLDVQMGFDEVQAAGSLLGTKAMIVLDETDCVVDAVLVRYAARLNGLSEIFLTKLDVLSGFRAIKVCTGYVADGETFEDIPSHQSVFHRAQPVYEELEGWDESLSEARSFGNLPPAARKYVERLQDLVGVRIGVVSVGPAREQSLAVA